MPLIRRDDLSTMQKAIVTEISVKNETYFFTFFYRSQSQSHDEFENFCSELNLLLININNNQPDCSILIGDFNEKCSKWCSSDKNGSVKIAPQKIPPLPPEKLPPRKLPRMS